MNNEEYLDELIELKKALAIVNRWQDREDGEELFNKITNEFLKIKLSFYERVLTDLFNDEISE
jgi:hypothetical protein